MFEFSIAVKCPLFARSALLSALPLDGLSLRRADIFVAKQAREAVERVDEPALKLSVTKFRILMSKPCNVKS